MNRPSIAKSLSSERLPSDQHRLEVMFDSLSVLASLGDWRVCNALWGAFCEGLEAHIRHVEEALIPTYAASSPAATHTACQILIEHERIRDELARVGMELQLRSLRTLGVKDLIELLREHARRESATLYPFWQQRESSVMATNPSATGFSAHSESCGFV